MSDDDSSTPVVPDEPDASHEFERPLDFVSKGGPREFARRTAGSWSEVAQSRVIEPEQTRSKLK